MAKVSPARVPCPNRNVISAGKRQALTHSGLSEERQKRLDALKVKREPQQSKLLETRILKSPKQ